MSHSVQGIHVTAIAATHRNAQKPALFAGLGARMVAPLDGQGDSPSLDRMAITLSGLCLVHCLASAVFFASVASVGAVLLNPLFHEVGLMVAIAFGVLALARGVVDHGYMMPFAVGSFGLGMMAGALSVPHDGGEIIWTMVGVAVLALGHDLNFRATRRLR
jgi:hypothetical protein